MTFLNNNGLVFTSKISYSYNVINKNYSTKMNILKPTKGPVLVQNSTRTELSSLQTCDEMQNICVQF